MTEANPIVRFEPERHEYFNHEGVRFPSVTWILAQSGICDFSYVEEETRRLAMQRGTSVHWMLQLQDQGALDYRKVPLKLRPYRKAYMDWRRASGFIPDWIERPFISHYGYAGTIDRTGSFPVTEQYPNGSRAIVDFKSGGVQNWTRFQLAAYAMRMHGNPSIAKTWRRVALGLHADGTYQVKEFPVSTWDYDFAIFLEAKRRVDDRHVDHDRDRD